MKIWLRFSIFFLLFIFSCEQQPTGSDLHTVEGVVSNSHGALAQATASIDAMLNWTAQTDADGYFKITEVNAGAHTLTIESTGADESFVTISKDIEVTSDLLLESLMLPSPVHLYPPDSVTVDAMLIRWSQTDAVDFFEYKLFRHDSPGLDETTGELIYVSTERNDTSFADTQQASGSEYYYRLYLMNQYGRLGGSNIVSATTLIGNLFPDPSFEDTTSLGKNWYLGYFNGSGEGNIIEYDDSVKFAGNTSLHISSTNQGMWLDLVHPILLTENSTYVFSVYCMASGMLINDVIGLEWDIDEQYVIVFETGGPQRDVSMDWTQRSVTFLKSDSTPFDCKVWIGIEDVWIDSVSLMPIPN